MRDLLNTLVSKVAKTIAAISTNTTTNGAIIDLQGFVSARFDFLSGTLTDGTYACSLQHGDAANLSDAADVPAAQVLGTVSFAATDDDTVKSLAYIGSKRYVRVKIVSTGGTLGAVAVLGRQRHAGGKAV